MPRKPRCDARLNKLTPEQTDQLANWLISGLGYESAVLRVKKEFGVSTSTGGLAAFWERECAPRVLLRRSRAASLAEQISQAATAQNPHLDEGIKAQLRQRAFEILVDPTSDPEAVMLVVGQMMTLSKLDAGEKARELKQEALKLQRDKFQFDAAKACLEHLPQLKQIASTPSLNEREKIDRIRERLFGELPDEKTA